MISRLIDRFIAWCQAREPHPLRVVRHEDRSLLLHRYQPFWPDEWHTQRSDGGIVSDRPPWWRPFNILLHQWVGAHNEEMHDHPRWSITIVLRGTLIEHTPWKSRVLKPGSIVIRSRKYIHAFEFVAGVEPWTIFVVGRRNHQQNGFIVKPFGAKPYAQTRTGRFPGNPKAKEFKVSLFGIHILTDAQLAALKAAGHEVETFAVSEASKAVSVLKTTDIGAAVTSAINTVEHGANPDGTPMTGAEKFASVVQTALPLIAKYIGHPEDALSDLIDIGNSLVQDIFNDVKSSTAGKIAGEVLKAVGL